MKLSTRVALCAMGALMVLGLAGCAGQESGENAPAGQEAAQESAASLEQEIIGVWEGNDSTIAIDETNFFADKNAGFFEYSVSDDGKKITLTNAKGEYGFTLSDNNNTLEFTDGYYEGKYTRTDQNPDAFISENVIVLEQTDSWENEYVGIEMFGSEFAEDEVIYHNGSTRRMPDGECELLFETDATNKTGNTIETQAVMYINNETNVSPSITGLFVNPFDQEQINYSYEIAPSAKDSISACRIAFRYVETDTSEVITPLIVVNLI